MALTQFLAEYLNKIHILTCLPKLLKGSHVYVASLIVLRLYYIVKLQTAILVKKSEILHQIRG